MEKLRVLVLGDGLLGSEIVNQSGWDYISRKKDSFDIDDVSSFQRHFMDIFDGVASRKKYDVIVNCIANTDTYSVNKEEHWRVNYVFVNNLISFCNKFEIKLVHISTDYIYSGSKQNASEEDVPVHCDNWYGYTKLLSDGLVQLLSNNYLICRCTHKPNPFPYESAWIDQVGNFDYVDVISKLIIETINGDLKGIYNIGTEIKTMHQLAMMTRKSKAVNAPLNVPKNTSMDTSKLKKDTHKPFFSIPIPTYGYSGKGSDFLEHSLDILSKQTFKDFEVVISDHSMDDTIYDVYTKWSKILNIKFVRNDKGRGVISPNINNAMRLCVGSWIKILFQDDFLYGYDALEKQYNFIQNNPDVIWFAGNTHVSSNGSSIEWSFQPKWIDSIWTGNNHLGCPTNFTIKNKDLIFFDEGLNWLMDVDYYMKMRDKFGDVKILDEYTIVNRRSLERLSNNISKELKDKEFYMMRDRYAPGSNAYPTNW